jgi:hypothetical protein
MDKQLEKFFEPWELKILELIEENENNKINIKKQNKNNDEKFNKG